MAILYEVMAPNGQYMKDGQEKTRWLKCGVIVATATGKIALKLEGLPVNPAPNRNGEGGLWLQCFEPNQEKDNLHTANAPAQGQGFRQPAQPAPAPALHDPQQAAELYRQQSGGSSQPAPAQPAMPAQVTPTRPPAQQGFEDDDIPF